MSREEPQRASDVFSTLVRTYRRRARLTQEALALRTGLSTRTIRNLEAGSLHRPRHATIRLLSEGLGLNDFESAAFTAAEKTCNAAVKRRMALCASPDIRSSSARSSRYSHAPRSRWMAAARSSAENLP